MVVPQVLFEVWAVATRPVEQNGLGLPVLEAATLISGLRESFSLREDPEGLTDVWLTLVIDGNVKGKPSHDARLVAAMQAHAIQHILTFNTGDFQRYPGVTALDPAAVAGKGGAA